MRTVSVKELQWTEQSLGEVEFPKERLALAAGFGSGLATPAKAPGSEVWAICDRGPNLKLKDAQEIYGWEAPADWQHTDGAKLMPRPDVGPALALLDIDGEAVRIARTVRLTGRDGRPISGLPIPEGGHAECEPVLGLDGRPCDPDPSGMDTEGLALLEDGSFWAAEEYGPSLIRITADGVVRERLVPEGVTLDGAGYEVRPSLPALAAKRHLNRGFEALAASPSGKHLFVAFQSPLAHPGVEAHKKARHVRLWRLDAEGGIDEQFLYRLDDPDTFLRDNEQERIGPSDLKICEMAAVGERQLLVLERGSKTSKIYRVEVDEGRAVPAKHLRIETRPTVEEISCNGGALPELPKQLLFTSDDWPQVGADIEGMALIGPRSLLIVSDNDFGCEGKQTRFFRLDFPQDLLAAT